MEKNLDYIVEVYYQIQVDACIVKRKTDYNQYRQVHSKNYPEDPAEDVPKVIGLPSKFSHRESRCCGSERSSKDPDPESESDSSDVETQ